MYFHFHLLSDICAVLASSAAVASEEEAWMGYKSIQQIEIVFRMSYTLQQLYSYLQSSNISVQIVNNKINTDLGTHPHLHMVHQ